MQDQANVPGKKKHQRKKPHQIIQKKYNINTSFGFQGSQTIVLPAHANPS